MAKDWEKIELEYRAGVKTLRQIASDNGVGESTIRARAKTHSWTRDLSVKIQQKADEIVLRQEQLRNPLRTENYKLLEQDTIDSNANLVATIRLEHRRDISRARNMTNKLFDELDVMLGNDALAALMEIGELMYKPDEKGKDQLYDAYQKVISMPGRVRSLKELGDTLKTLVGLERQAYGLDDDNNRPVDALTQILTRISNSNNNTFKPVAHDHDYDREDTSSLIKEDDPDHAD